MSDLLIHNARMFTGQRAWNNGWLYAREGKIAALGVEAPPDYESAEQIDARGEWLFPGFIDIHVHGGMGAEAMDATPEALATMARFYARHGVTGFLATTWTDSRERIDAALRNAAAFTGVDDGAQMLGVHLEGPYLNPAKTGAQNPDHIRRAEREEALQFLDYGVINLVALAPEYEENHWLIRECVKRGITVSAAHTNATYEQMVKAVQLGVTQTTHTFNAMTPLNHREPGVVGAALTMPELRCEIICDFIHVHSAAIRLLWQAKGEDGTILISDAVRPAGLPEGDYENDGRPVRLEDGAIRLPDGTLAGSVLTMDRAVENVWFSQYSELRLFHMMKLASLNAARAANVSHRKGSLEIGKDADLVLFRLTNSVLDVNTTIVGGRVVYQREPGL